MTDQQANKLFQWNHFLYISNLVTICRIFLALPVYWTLRAHNLTLLFFLVLIGVASDYLDGYLARSRNQVSELGKILDPLADKTVIIFTALALMADYGLPGWLGWTIIIRDVLIIIGSFFLSAKIKVVNPSNWMGKITVNVIAFTLIFYMFEINILIPTFTWLSLAFIIISLISYSIEGIKKLK